MNAATLNVYEGLVREHGALAQTPALTLIRQLRAMREASSNLLQYVEDLHAELNLGRPHSYYALAKLLSDDDEEGKP